MFTGFCTVGFTSELGMSQTDAFILIVAVILRIVVDITREKGKSIYNFVVSQEGWFRWTVYSVMFWFVLMLGIYGGEYDSSQFIYF